MKNSFYYLAKGFAKRTKNGSKRWPLKPGQRSLLPCDLSELMDRLVAINVLEVVMSESLTQLNKQAIAAARQHMGHVAWPTVALTAFVVVLFVANLVLFAQGLIPAWLAKQHHHKCCEDRKSTRLNYSHVSISYADFCL